MRGCSERWGATHETMQDWGSYCLRLALVLGAGRRRGAARKNPPRSPSGTGSGIPPTPAELRAYLEAYPNGAFADVARARLKQLEASPRPGCRPQPTPVPRPGGGKALTDAAVDPRGPGAALQSELRDQRLERPADRGDPQRHPRVADQHQARADGRADARTSSPSCAMRAFPPPGARWPMRRAAPAPWCGTGRRARRPSAPRSPTAARNAGRDNCKVVTAAESACGALGFYMGNVRRDHLLGRLRHRAPDARPGDGPWRSPSAAQQAKRPEACGVRLTFCADGSHKQ